MYLFLYFQKYIEAGNNNNISEKIASIKKMKFFNKCLISVIINVYETNKIDFLDKNYS